MPHFYGCHIAIVLATLDGRMRLRVTSNFRTSSYYRSQLRLQLRTAITEIPDFDSFSLTSHVTLMIGLLNELL
jgi:hypothetical protein